MTLKDLNVGDTFINSYGNLTTIKKICIRTNDIYLESDYGTKWIVSAGDFIGRVKQGKYTDYKPIKPVKGWKCGPLDRDDALLLIKYMGSSSISTTKSNNYFYFDGYDDFGRYIRGGKGPAKNYFDGSKLPKKKLNEIIMNNKNFKIGDIVTFKSIHNVFTPSNDFEGEIEHIDSKGLRLKILKGNFKYNHNSKYDYRRIKGYKTGRINFEYVNFIKLNTNNKDEKIREINTEYRRQKGGAAISSNSTRKIANASRLVGNTISNRVKTTRVGRFEISRTAISA